MSPSGSLLRSTTIGLLMSCLILTGCEKVTRIVEIAAPAPPVQTPTPPPPAPPPPPPPPPAPPEPPETVAESLTALGVPMTDTPRISNEGVPLPPRHAPFGRRIHVMRTAEGLTVMNSALEFALVGFSLNAQSSFLTTVNDVVASTSAPLAPQVLARRDAAQAPWSREDRGPEWVASVTRRSAAAGDIDGDGIDELATARIENGQLILDISPLDGSAAATFQGVLPLPLSAMPANDVRLALGDVDDDGKSELVIAVSRARAAGQRTNTSILVLDDRSQDLAVRKELSFESTLTAVDVSVVIETGNIDYDVGHELVVALNEIEATNSNGRPNRAATRLFVFDDAARGYSQLLADVPAVVTSSASYQADVADVAIGDFDDDDINEIIVAGISGMTAITSSCNENREQRYLAVLYEFDGRAFGRTRMASSHDGDPLYPSTCADDGPWMMRFAFVNAVDLDGDLDHEFHINQYVFAGFPAAGALWGAAAAAQLPPTVLFPEGNNPSLVFDRGSATLEAADVNGDGRGDIVSFRGGNPQIEIFGVSEEDGFHRSGRMNVDTTDSVYATSAGRSFNPQIVAFSAEIANDARSASGEAAEVFVLDFVKHELDFTEAIVLVALAAPPCKERIGQNVEACTTTWGKSESTGSEGEREIKFKAGFAIGIQKEVSSGVGAANVKVGSWEVKGVLERETARLKSEAYEVTKSISFETGPLENSVVFTSIPYDTYHYRVAANNRDPEAEGMTFTIGVPREAVTRLATASYYNAHTPESALKIDESVFGHTVGDIDSYPNAAERDALLDEHRSQVENLRTDCPFCWQALPDSSLPFFDGPLRSFDPFAALPGLTTELVGVGQGSGSTEVALELNASNGNGRGLETSAAIEVEVVAGSLLLGFEIGGGVATSTTLTRGTGTSYVGTVGSIDDEHFLDNQYRFGLFTYLQADPGSGLEFEVINYWVE